MGRQRDDDGQNHLVKMGYYKVLVLGNYVNSEFKVLVL